MRIALFIPTLDATRGIATAMTLETALALKGLGHEIHLVSFDDPSEPFVSAVPEGLLVHAVGPVRGPYAVRGAWERKLSMIPAEAFILGELGRASTNALARYAHKRRIPYLLFPDVALAGEFKRHFCCLWRESRTVAQAASVCYTTRAEATLARRKFFPFHPMREDFPGLGLETYADSPEAAEASFREHFPLLSGQRPYLLYLNRFHSRCGADLLLKVLWEFPHLTLVMAGPLVGEQEYYVAKLKAMAPPGRVVWTGMLNEKLRWGALVGADALILPSGREEFGESAVAALSVGTAVLLSDKVAVGAEILGAGRDWRGQELSKGSVLF
jgi:glycosyltransferase involved in cell wall biosynthesis